MCEMVAMSARFPATFHLTMAELGRRGGGTGPHADGWGVGFVHDNDALVVREPVPAHRSDLLAFLQQQQARARIAIAHVRLATLGPRLLQNTQPYARELGGRMHLFMHNGTVHAVGEDARFGARRFRPIGDTDSEHAFCALLERLAPHWEADPPAHDERLALITQFAAELRELGPANFVYTDGDAVFAHGHRRRNDAGEIEPPGLHLFVSRCPADAAHAPAGEPPAEQHVAMVASRPLTDEGWSPLAEGELVVLRHGEVVHRVAPAARRERPVADDVDAARALGCEP